MANQHLPYYCAKRRLVLLILFSLNRGLRTCCTCTRTYVHTQPISTLLQACYSFFFLFSSVNLQCHLRPLKSGVGQYKAIHATLTARNFFFAYFYPSGPFTCIFFQNLSQFCPVLAVANTGSCVGPQNKIGHPVGCRFPC